MHVVYDGPVAQLCGERAIALSRRQMAFMARTMRKRARRRVVLVQFDDMRLPESLGRHRFPRRHFRKI